MEVSVNILGIGIDIVEIKRIEDALNKNKRFLDKLFTKEEIKYFESRNFKIETIAGNFAAKEAISKAMGTGIRNFNFTDIEVLRNELGKPIVEISNKVKELIKVDNYIFNISISHNRTCAIAFVVLESH